MFTNRKHLDPHCSPLSAMGFLSIFAETSHQLNRIFMGILDFLKKKSSPAKDISKDELEKQIRALDRLSQIFRNSPFLKVQGAGRSEKMASVLVSYKCIFAYFYGTVYDYGDPLQFIGKDEGIRFLLTTQGLEQPATRGNILRALPANWQDTMKVVDSLRIAEPVEFDAIQSEIDGIGRSISIFSRK